MLIIHFNIGIGVILGWCFIIIDSLSPVRRVLAVFVTLGIYIVSDGIVYLLTSIFKLLYIYTPIY